MEINNESEQVLSSVSSFSPSILPVYKQALVIASKKVPVLIEGESSVGKNHLAQFIHNNGNRSDKPFVVINGNEMSESLFASELFGYSANAFTGAGTRNKEGLIESANKGTILFSRINELSMNNQAILLHFLQNMSILPVGSLKYKQIDARIITTSNADLKDLCKSGLFREDLYYRISVINFRLPPLRERQEDIYSIFRFFVLKLAGYTITDGWPSKVRSDLKKLLLSYQWPGNIHELRNFTENFCLASDKFNYAQTYLEQHSTSAGTETPVSKTMDHVQPRDSYFAPDLHQDYSFMNEDLPLKEAVSSFERFYIERAIKKAGSLQGAARMLGIGYSSLCRKRAEYRESDAKHPLREETKN